MRAHLLPLLCLCSNACATDSLGLFRAPLSASESATRDPAGPETPDSTKVADRVHLESGNGPAAPGGNEQPAPAERAPALPVSAGRGFVADFYTGGQGLTGSMLQNRDVGGFFLTFGARVGGYVTEHWGALVGIHGGYGPSFTGCTGSCDNALTYEVPLVVQYALEDRRRGAYFEAGLALLPTYKASSDEKSSDRYSPETLSLTSSVEYTFGGGYRIPSGQSAFDVGADIQLGTFSHVDYSNPAGEVNVDIPDNKQSTHVAFLLAARYVIAP